MKWSSWLVALSLPVIILPGTSSAQNIEKCNYLYSRLGPPIDMKSRGLKMPAVSTNLRDWAGQLFNAPGFGGYQIADDIPLPEDMRKKMLKWGSVLWRRNDHNVIGVVLTDGASTPGSFLKGAKETVIEQCSNAAKISEEGPFPAEYLLGTPKLDSDWWATRARLACPGKSSTVMRVSAFSNQKMMIAVTTYSADENAAATADSQFFHALCSLSQGDK